MDYQNRKGSTNRAWYGLAAAGVTFLLWTVLKPAATVAPIPIVRKATVTVSGDSKVVGTVTFSQESVAGPVTISGHIEGLDANAKRGFHIHNLGDLSGGCVSAGPHFNPLGLTHGARVDTVRHKGDLGNIDSDDKGVANFEFTDSGISLNGPFTVIGRAVMVHAGTDDLGQGGDEESKKTGNAGGRSACGVIGIAALA